MKRGFSLAILIFSLIVTNGQTPDLKETFLEAESYFLFEEYNEALPLYLRLRRADATNDNINYKIGICFLNDPYQKDKSVFYLEEASKNVNPKYKENNYRETTAPLEAFFYLGNAYLVNNDIDKALENYKYFRSILDEKIYDVELVDQQIRICEIARELRKQPVDYDNVNLTEIINSRFADINPITSGDGNRIVFVSKRQFYDATFFSEKVNGIWQPARNIIPELGVDGDVYPTSLSWDGNKMIIYRNDDFIGNLYESEYIDGRWTNMKKLGDNINTKYWESHGSLSKDGKTLYFTSNRKDGYGGLDIYKSNMNEDGGWDVPINLGNEINTRYNEETPFITENGKILYFSSYGHYNMGGYDVFYSQVDEDGNWGTPINLGYPINTTDDDIFYFPVNDGANAYFSQYLEDGFGRHDIYYLSVYSENNPRMYLITGSLNSDKGPINEKDDVQLFLVDQKTGDTIQVGKPNLVTQGFELKAPKGQYNLILKSLTFNDLITKITINEKTEKSGIRLENEMELVTKPYVPLLLEGDKTRIIIEDSLFNAKPGEKLKMKLNLVKGSKLYVTHSSDGIVIASDTFDINRKNFVYEIIPEKGVNVIEFIMIEENGDKSLKSIIINSENVEDNSLKKDTIITSVNPDDIEDNKVSGKVDSNIQVQKVVDDLTTYASGDLKKLLNNLDTEKEGISTTEELISYLKDQGFEEEKIIDLIAVSKVENNANELLERLLQNSDGELHEFLKTIDLEELGIQTAAELIEYIRSNADELGVKQEDISSLLKDATITPPGLEKTMNDLLPYASGELKNFLINLDPEKEGISTTEELISYLKDQGFEEDKIIDLIAVSKVENNANELLERLLQNSNGELHEFLKTIDLEELGIKTAAELIEYIRSNADELGLEQEIINDLLKDATISPSGQENTLKELLTYAKGDLYEYLSNMNMDSLGIYSTSELLDHLIEHVGEEYQAELLVSVLSDIISDRSLEDFKEFLIANSPKELAALLKKLNTKKEGISSIEELIAYILNNAEEMGLTDQELELLIIKQMAKFKIASILDSDPYLQKGNMSKGLKITGGLALFGILIFIIFYYRRKKEEEKAESE